MNCFLITNCQGIIVLRRFERRATNAVVGRVETCVILVNKLFEITNIRFVFETLLSLSACIIVLKHLKYPTSTPRTPNTVHPKASYCFQTVDVHVDAQTRHVIFESHVVCVLTLVNRTFSPASVGSWKVRPVYYGRISPRVWTKYKIHNPPFAKFLCLGDVMYDERKS